MDSKDSWLQFIRRGSKRPTKPTPKKRKNKRLQRLVCFLRCFPLLIISFLCFSVLQNRPCIQNFNNQRHLISYLLSYELYIDIYIFYYSCAISRLVLSIFRGAKLVQRDPKAHRDPQVQKGQRSRYRSS